MGCTDDQVIDVLKTGAQICSTVAQKVGCSDGVTRKRLDNLVSTGKVKVQFFANSTFKVYILA